MNEVVDVMESCVPPGFRFHPTDEELVGYYLKKKVASERIDLDVIRDIDLYRIEPWDLQERCRIGYDQQNDWYFFSHKDKKYPTGTRTNRATMAGFWKATGRDKAVREKNRLIGMRKTLVFYKGRAPNGQKTDWIMHEYRLESNENGPPQEEGWVVCRAFKKRTPNCHMRTHEPWDPIFCYDGPIGLDPPNHYTHHLPCPPNNACKQETEHDHQSFLRPNPSHFIELPHLESPSLPPAKRRNALLPSLEEESSRSKAKVTDWRTLDRFVASQLSPEEKFEGEGVSEFGVQRDPEMELFLLQSSGEEAGENKLDELLSSSCVHI